MAGLNREEAPEQGLLSLSRTPPIRPLWLTREEALRLLELAVASPTNPDGDEERALSKLGDLCRAFLRDDGAHAAGR